MGTEPRGRPSAETGKVSSVWKPDRGFGFPTREKEQPKGTSKWAVRGEGPREVSE